MRQAKIVIVGAGLVGGSAALFVALAIPSAKVVIIDVARVRAEGQALDLAHAAAFWGHSRFRAGDYEDARDADIVVITAGAGVKPGETRLHLAKTNADIATEIVGRIAPLAPEAIYLIATNPCDVLTGAVYDQLRCERERVISTGTSLDTGRLRSLLSERFGVVASAIHAYVLGEHGESAVIQWSAATVCGMPLETFLTRNGKELGPASRDLILRSVHEAAKLIKEGKGATHYGIASAIGRICEAIVHDTDLILTVGIVEPEVEGVPDVCVSLPMVVNGAGARLIAYPELDPIEREALLGSARIVKEATESVLHER
ncbi:L-lactate dehydrogenase [Paraburkholderia atlantica]|uniref:L-lactate dehydrogenase n=1 Tax=Paraburkholderia atlantica TaxID=2654982 RepID=D5WGB7_PARAM|nr:lactate dehydrogenase [Paraburkholderia atlantica]ADG17536.1 Lactate/malate dehydrogenase [Paraburkholderia atlantica]MBB5420060.1 L-lactate dehydrogenase [Paraburkholderia atlantica]MBB5425534.1 L-lactate dehydrogenase [Paraburkholderia atlantica]MBB5508333.1 L-lactate dehydrogenase [Paraburkholderia atlantica]MPW08016.1 lactate dehydrogenase [Paraburkholderia atlantica]